MNKLFLVLYNKESKFYFTKYFENVEIMDKYIKKLWFSKRLILIEDSRDILFY